MAPKVGCRNNAISRKNSMSFSQDMDDEYEKLIRKMNPPRVVIDNDSCKSATIIQVDSANEYGILFEVVQILTDLNLTVTKAYISYDGGWFMDVFNVTDQDGKKITDVEVLDYIHKALGPDSDFAYSVRRSVGVKSTMDHTAIELIGCDRPGLLSEVSAVLTHLKCNVVSAEVWNHNTRAAAVNIQLIFLMYSLKIYRAKHNCSGIEQHPGTTLIHQCHSGSDQDAVKITVTGSSVNSGSTSKTLSLWK